MNERGRNEADISRYTDVEYSPEGYKTVYRWGDFLEIAGGHVYNAMDTIDLVSAGGEYEGFNPRYAYTCEFVGCSTLIDGIALFRPVSRDGEDLTQIAFLRSDIDDDTGAYTERFEAGSFDIAAASDIQCSDLGIDLLDYFRGRSFEGLSGVKRGLNGREAVGAVEVATGCDLDLFEDFWLGSPGETDVHVGPYVKRDLIALSYIVNDFSQMYGTTARDIRKLLARVNNFHPDRLAAVKAYLDCEYVTDRDTSDEKTYRWSDFLEIAGGDARYAAMLIERTAPGEPQEGLHPETLVDQDIRDGEAFMLAGRPIAPEDIYDLPGTVHGLYSELVDNVGRSGTLARDWRGFSAGTDADDVLREIDGAFGETEYSRAGTVLGAYADDTFMSPFFAADDAARDVTPLTPWEDENGVAFLSRTFDADAAAVVPCLWYCRRDEGQGFEVGGVKLDCSKIGFDEVSNEAASNGFDCVLTDRFNDGLDEARLADCKNIADEFARAIESRLGSGHLGRALYVDGDCLRDDLTDKFGFSYDIDFSGLTFKTSLILSINGLYSEGDVIDAASDWQEDYLPRGRPTNASAIGAARARTTGGSTSPPRATGPSRVPRTSPRASSTSCAPRRARPSRRSSTTP